LLDVTRLVDTHQSALLLQLATLHPGLPEQAVHDYLRSAYFDAG